MPMFHIDSFAGGGQRRKANKRSFSGIMVLPLSKAFAAIIRLNIGIIITSVAVTQATMQWQPFIGSCEIQAFRDHLDRQYLRNVIILYDERKTHQGNASLTKIRSPGITQQEQSAGTGDWEDFTNYYFLKFFNMENSNEQDFKELLHKYYPRTAFLLALSPGNVDHLRILLLASNNGLFNYSMSWFVFMQDNENEQHLANIHQTFGPLNIELNADITVAYKRDNCKFDLYDVHKVCYKCGSPLVMEYKGNWSPAYGLDLQEIFKHSFVSRRNNWKNESVNVGTALLNYSPDLQMSMVEYLEDSKRYLENDLMMRKAYQLIQMVQGVYNFTFRLKFSDGWGIPLNNTWTGVMGLVVRDEVEFSVAPLRFTSERIRQVVYSQVVHVERVRFLFRHPKRSSIRNIFFEPLATTVWWCVFALTVITGILLAIHVYAEYRWYWKVQLAKGEEPPQHDIEPDVDFIVFTTLETIFMQGPTPEHFNANSTRLLLTSVSAFTIILMQFYGAFVVSSLLSEAPRSITNLPALYGSNLEIGMEDIPYNYEFFASTSSPVVRNIYNNRICKKGTRNIVSLEEGADRIGQGGFAFHASLNRIYRILAEKMKGPEFCELQEITFTTPFWTALVMPKRTPYRKFVTSAILKFGESSLIYYNDKRWEIPKIDCSSVSQNDVEVDLAHFAPVLVFMAFSIVTSLWVFVMEFLFYKRGQNQIHVNFKNIWKTMRKYLINKQRVNVLN